MAIQEAGIEPTPGLPAWVASGEVRGGSRSLSGGTTLRGPATPNLSLRELGL